MFYIILIQLILNAFYALKWIERIIIPFQFLCTEPKILEANPLSCKQTCEDLNAYNPPTTPATLPNINSNVVLRHIVQILNKNDYTLIKENRELTFSFKNIKKTNRYLYDTNNNYEVLNKDLDTKSKLLQENLESEIYDCNVLSDKVSLMKSKITTLKSLNDKYINENKVLKSKIEKMWNEIKNTDDFCKDLNRFNKD